MKKLFVTLSTASLFALSLAVLNAPSAQAADAKPATLKISSKGDTLTFDKAKLSAKVGQKIKLTFTNASKADSGLQHNWVLTQPGKDAEVGSQGMTAGADKGWIPENPAIIAHTKLLDAGKSETIEFTAPDKAGEYPYLCTFPGHASMMKGVLTVK